MDIGGSHISAALIDLSLQRMLPGTFHRAPVNAQGDANEIITSWCAVMQQSMAFADGVTRIGMAMPGPFDYERGIAYIKGLQKYDALYGLCVKDLLANELGIQASGIRMTNDAACFLQGELFSGAAKGQEHVLGFTLGTGFGSAIARNGFAQDAGYWSAPFRGTIAEEFFSTRWFLKRYEELSGVTAESVKSVAAKAGTDKAALELFHEFGRNLAAFLHQLQELPEFVVLGGNIARAFGLFHEVLKAGMGDKKVTFVPSALGEEVTLVGAAGFWQGVAV